MTGLPPTVLNLDALDLAALLCSRVCHDVISPVGAIVNGLEVLEDKDSGADMREFAMELIRKSAKTASARLQFCRLAFGAAGSAGASIDTGDAESVARGLIADDKTKLVWNAARTLMPKNKVKLVLNLALIASAAIPRGGVLTVTIDETASPLMKVEATGTHVRLASHVAALLDGQSESGSVDAHGIQAYYSGLVAREAGLSLSVDNNGERVIIAATAVHADSAAA